jgi:hypothetical protein
MSRRLEASRVGGFSSVELLLDYGRPGQILAKATDLAQFLFRGFHILTHSITICLAAPWGPKVGFCPAHWR